MSSPHLVQTIRQHHVVHYSSGKDNWETPQDLFDTYHALFHFDLDAAANDTNHKCPRWWGPGGEREDALVAPWALELAEGHNIWLNPPYSRGLQSKFVKCAAMCAHLARHMTDGSVGNVVCLLPARTDTKLFHEIIQPYGKITFLKGRVKFVGATHGAPFPSMMVVF